jgi:hypothetical protein
VYGTFPAHFILIYSYLTILIYTVKSSNYEAPHYAVFPIFISSLLGPYILLSVLFSNTFSPYSSCDVRFQVSHLCKTTGKIIVLYVNFCSVRQTRQKVLNWMVLSITLIQSALIFCMNYILIRYSHSKIFELCLIFERSVNFLYVRMLTSILVTR